MANLELESIKKYLNGLHRALASLKKDEPVDSFTFAKLYVNEDELVMLLNADITDFAETGVNVDPVEDEKQVDTKVGVNVCDNETYANALKAIEVVADKYGLVNDAELEVEEVNPDDYLYHEGDVNVRALVYTPTTKEIVVKVPYLKETVVTRMVPLTFTQKLVMKGATEKDQENREKIRKHFDALLDRFMTKKVKYRLTKKCIKVTYKRDTLCKMVISGKKVIKVYLALNPYKYEENYRVIDCSDKTSYQDVPTCLKVTGRVSLHRAYELIDDVLKNYEVPENKKYVANYPYSKDIVESYKQSLKEKAAA